MTALSDLIKRQIRDHGPMDVGAFMGLALGHPQHGYYMTRDPLGAAGDFTTAPEISQMFGELVGAWAAHAWIEMGQPSSFVLAEAGPGRGTLMADALRATGHVKGFHQTLKLHLLETSPVLRERQKDALAGHDPCWHAAAETLLDGFEPLILIGNEFLDALPARQLQWQGGAWHERVVGLENDRLVFGLAPDRGLGQNVPSTLKPEEGDIYEASPEREAFVRQLCQALLRRGGSAILIDYGHSAPGFGDTLQAVKGHEYVPVLDEPGQADLTSHVDFFALKRIAHDSGCTVYGPVIQGEFLENIGVRERAMALSKGATPVQAGDIKAALERLINPADMGKLFKVLVISAPLTRKEAE